MQFVEAASPNRPRKRAEGVTMFNSSFDFSWVLNWQRVSGGTLIRLPAIEGICRSSFWYVPRRG